MDTPTVPNPFFLARLQRDILDLKQEVKEIKNALERIERNTRKMDRHVDFVDKVYESVRSPVSYIINSFSSTKAILPPNSSGSHDEIFTLIDETKSKD